ncbi:DUF6318 family protein [Neomicrococcus lactis]|uniref:DUF6318 family protein n=1 Tax=Neomicrococcus lactis TaxID=732241 RepID=UPI002300CFF8|nr:DUF6318 family protein [Neomicrococcus lactis]
MTSLKHAASKNFVPIGSVLALCGAVALTGCSASANGENPTSAASNGSSNASASSSVVASGAASSSAASASPQEATPTSPAKNIPEPVMPKEAKEHSAKGLEAFTRYWFKVSNYSQKTSDTSQLMSLCVEDSAYCEKRKELADQFRDRNAWPVGGEASIGKFFTQMKTTPAGYTHALIELKETERKIFDATGEQKSGRAASSSVSVEVYSIWVNGEWKFLAPHPIEGADN